ncbi:MAG: outer membrane beta-barrel protein [Planctomycetota bacterium]
MFRRASAKLLLAALGWLASGDAALGGEQAEPRSEPPSSQWDYPMQDETWEAAGPAEAVRPAEAAPLSRMFLRLSECVLPSTDLGQPLHGTSWLNRPYYASAFSGTWLGDTLISGQVSQESGFFSGAWVGTDLNDYWGSELRLSLFYINTMFSDGSRGPDSRNLLGDANVLYYPWGDSPWRPYGSIGLGFAGVHFSDPNGAGVDHTGLQLPIGLGVKYLWRNWLAWRLDIKDNIAFSGNGVNTTDSWSFVGGVEVHWGSKSSKRYAPW